MGAGLIGALVLGTGAVLASSSEGGAVTIRVPGAINISAYCGGEQTHFADGEQITFVPEGNRCDLEAPLSQVMPLRGQIDLGRSSTYRCDRDGMDLVCRGS
jgi:hypothetical protein